jgi:hypothetical protein
MTAHRWSFATIGGVKRVQLERGADLAHLDELDPKLWTALSCPVQGLEIDAATLRLIDTDGDGQIRVPEVLAAVRWMLGILKNPDDLLLQEDSLPLAAIDPLKENGARLLESAKVILHNLGHTHDERLSLSLTGDTLSIFANSLLNGDGLITPASAADPAIAQLIGEIMATQGSEPDRSGAPGIGYAQLHAFYEAIDSWLAAHDALAADARLQPFGEQTEAALHALDAVSERIDDYFLRCRLAAYDPAAAAALNLQTERVMAITHRKLSEALDEIAGYPLARIEAGRPLPLKAGLNPAWEAPMAELVRLCKLGTSLDEIGWQQLKNVLEPFRQWLSSRHGQSVAPLGLDRCRALQSGPEREVITQLIAADLELADEVASILEVDQLVRYYRDLFRLLQNFVTFHDFYAPGREAIFQAGTLYIDQRSTELCMKVLDMNRHNAMVGLSGMFLLYCDCRRRATGEEMRIVAALTNGDIDNLVEGRNALFYDRLGRDWDATVVKIVDNPISIRQAFWTPYRKVSRFIEQQVNNFAAAQETKSDKMLTDGVGEAAGKAEQAALAPAPAAAAPATPFDVGKFVGIFAAISLALGAIGTALASVVSGFMGLVWWKMPIAIAGILLLISGPSMLLAWLKLRRRNLAPLLDANGWAINARATVNIRFGNTLTRLAELPEGANINFVDPLAGKKRPFLPLILLLCLLAGALGFALWKGWIRF